MTALGDDLVGYDRKTRPYMKLGPSLIWWLVGAGGGSLGFAVLVVNFSPHLDSPARRWMGAIGAVIALAYVALGAWLFVRRFRQYRTELHRRGQRHAVPTQPPPDSGYRWVAGSGWCSQRSTPRSPRCSSTSRS